MKIFKLSGLIVILNVGPTQLCFKYFKIFFWLDEAKPLGMCVVTVMGFQLNADQQRVPVKSSLLDDRHCKSSVHLNVDKAITYV